LPNEIPFSFFMIPTNEAVSSGILVPIETTVIAIILSLIPKFLAKVTDPLIKRSEPSHKETPPKTKYMMIFLLDNVLKLLGAISLLSLFY